MTQLLKIKQQDKIIMGSSIQLALIYNKPSHSWGINSNSTFKLYQFSNVQTNNF